MYLDFAMLCLVYTCWIPALRSSQIWSRPICFSPWGFWLLFDDIVSNSLKLSSAAILFQGIANSPLDENIQYHSKFIHSSSERMSFSCRERTFIAGKPESRGPFPWTPRRPGPGAPDPPPGFTASLAYGPPLTTRLPATSALTRRGHQPLEKVPTTPRKTGSSTSSCPSPVRAHTLWTDMEHDCNSAQSARLPGPGRRPQSLPGWLRRLSQTGRWPWKPAADLGEPCGPLPRPCTPAGLSHRHLKPEFFWAAFSLKIGFKVKSTLGFPLRTLTNFFFWQILTKNHFSINLCKDESRPEFNDLHIWWYWGVTKKLLFSRAVLSS